MRDAHRIHAVSRLVQAVPPRYARFVFESFIKSLDGGDLAPAASTLTARSCIASTDANSKSIRLKSIGQCNPAIELHADLTSAFGQVTTTCLKERIFPTPIGA
jgi:hypothetical protein